MRLLGLLTWTTPILLIGCTYDNPAFDDCDGPDQCLAEDSGTGDQGPGDGDSGDGNPGDGESGDGDGDGESGDGDGDSGDGDGESGDGDGDPNALPACPETVKLELLVVKDTFLVAGPEEGGICIVGWDLDLWQPKFNEFQQPCSGLGFGAAALHWVCNNGSCKSAWLGRFNVGGYAEQAPKVTSAKVEFWSKVVNEELNHASLYTLGVDHSVFGDCNDWEPGDGWGAQVSGCETSWKYAAQPHLWSIDELLGNSQALGTAPIPAGELVEHQVIIPIASELAQGWLVNDPHHLGVILRSQAWLPTEFMLMAKESDKPPRLVLEVCSEL
ncbi:MAG: hypothetical protein R6X02_06545 [Enhygromyxa sp.]